MLTISSSEDGVELVDLQCSDEERVAEQPEHGLDRRCGSDDSCRRVGHRLGYYLTSNGTLRILDRGRKRNFDQCAGVMDVSQSIETPWAKIPRLNDPDLHRQHDATEIRGASRRHSLTPTTGPCHRHPGNSQSLSTQVPLFPHSRDQEHAGGSTVPSDSTALREELSLALVPLRATANTQDDHRRLCIEGECETPNILEPTVETGGTSNGCLPPTMAPTRVISPSTMAVDSEGVPKTTGRQGTDGSAFDADMAHSVLVADGVNQS